MTDEEIGKLIQDAIEKDRAYLKFAQDQAKESREYFSTIFTRTAWFITLLTLAAGALGYGSFTAVRDQSKSLVDSEIKRSDAELSAAVADIRAKSQSQLDDVRSKVEQRVAEEFQTQNIREVVIAVAKQKTNSELTSIIRSETALQVARGIEKERPAMRNAVVNETKQAVTAEAKQAVHDLQPSISNTIRDAVKDNIKSAVEPVEAKMKSYEGEMAAQKRRNDVASLQVNVISTGDRTSLEQLIHIGSDPKESMEIRNLAASEIAAAKIFWFTADETIGDQIQWRGADGKPKAEGAVTVCELLSALQNNADWHVRDKAVKLLAFHRNDGVPEALLRAIEEDPQLHVVRDAVRTFSNLTGFQSPDTFGVPQIENWWQQHSEEQKKGLANLDCAP